MASVSEHELFGYYIGKPVDKARLDTLADYHGYGPDSYSDCRQYIIYQGDFYEDPVFQHRFRITPFLKERWNESGVDFRIFLFIKRGVIAGGHIFIYQEKLKKSTYRPSGYSRDPTQQEIRIAARILEYLSPRDKKEKDYATL